MPQLKLPKSIIHIYGASGAGTSTLGRYISKELNYFFMDTDDYYWLPTPFMFTTPRNKSERIKMMKRDMEKSDRIVISGSLVGWGDELIPAFTLCIRLITLKDVRIGRIKERESRQFGSRIKEGGDMYQNHLDFIEWAAQYDSGSVEMRSKAMHDEWDKLLLCKQIVLNGADSLPYNLQQVKRALDE